MKIVISKRMAHEQETAVLLVHLGPKPITGIVSCCIQQLLNTQDLDRCRICLYITHPEAIYGMDPRLISESKMIILTPEQVPTGELRKEFQVRTRLDGQWHYGYWKVCSERFFAIYDVAEALGLRNFFHIETDVLVYWPFSMVLSVLNKKNVELAVTPLNEKNVVPGIIYYRDPGAARMVAEYFLRRIPDNKTDMLVLGEMMSDSEFGKRVYQLPMMPAGTPDVSPFFSNDQAEFGCVFDGAAIGQWLGGVDALCGRPEPLGTPHVNQEASYRFDKEFFSFDDYARPYVNGVPIFNMHIHSKQLARWMSKSLCAQSCGLT